MSFALPQFFGYAYQPSAGAPPVGPVTTSMGVSWSLHVQANGGAAPSAGAITAVNVFWTRLVNDGIAPYIYEMAVFTDSISASCTPITSSTNKWLWYNNGFVAADLDVNGLYASSSAKYLDTRISFSAVLTSSNDVGWSLYSYSTDAGSTYQNDFGILGTQRFHFGQASGSTSYFDVWAVTGGRISGVPSGSGLVTYNRTSNTTAAVYLFSSAYPNGQTIASSTGLSQGTMPGNRAYLFRMYGDGNARNTNKHSFAALHRGFSAAQAKTFYQAVQQLRTDLGGGYK